MTYGAVRARVFARTATFLCETDRLAFLAGDEPATDCGACIATPHHC